MTSAQKAEGPAPLREPGQTSHNLNEVVTNACPIR
jgi:hypothetical protein